MYVCMYVCGVNLVNERETCPMHSMARGCSFYPPKKPSKHGSETINVCMYECMYVCMYEKYFFSTAILFNDPDVLYGVEYIHALIRKCMCVCTYVYYVRMYACMYVCMYVC